jgi:uncharacterized protein YjbI with pentapeptide repeats
MGRSLRVSEEGLKKAKEAFQLTGWTQDYLAGSVKCTRPTVNKFLAGGYVEKRIFEALCSELKLRVADIADLESEEGLVNTSVSVNGNREQSLATLTQKQTETDEERAAFAATGTIAKSDIPKVKAILALLQEITGDTSIKIVDIGKGSIRLILEGSQESLEQIEALFKSGQLTEVEGIPVEDVQFVAPKIPENDEDIQAIDKKRLAFTIAGSVSSEEIEELKAAFSETSDNEEEIEADDKARLVREIITQGAKGRIMRGADLSGADLRGADLRSANLSSANLSRADLSRANLRSADLRSADLSGAYLSGAYLSGARINAQTKIDSKWRLVWEIVNQGARKRDLIGIDLSGANLSSANLSGADLSRANLSGADLSGADLRGANLRGANLRGANLRSADLSDADLRGAILNGAILNGANMRGANLSSANLSGADLRGANLNGAILRGADLSSANLRFANLRFANLSGANLSGAVVENAQFGDNLGLTEEMKLDLKRRGAIFEDSPGDRSGVLSRR